MRPAATSTKLPSLTSPFWAPDAEAVISTATEALTVAALDVLKKLTVRRVGPPLVEKTAPAMAQPWSLPLKPTMAEAGRHRLSQVIRRALRATPASVAIDCGGPARRHPPAAGND